MEIPPEVSRYLPLVRTIALRIKEKLPVLIEVQELMEAGTTGLKEAILQFKPRQGVTFRTFAYYCLRGAMYRRLDNLEWPIALDRAEHKFRKKVNELMQTRSISAESIVKRSLRAEATEVKELIQDLILVYLFSVKNLERTLMDRLEEYERRFAQLYYDDDLRLDSTAESMGLSKADAARHHFKMLEKIRGALIQDA